MALLAMLTLSASPALAKGKKGKSAKAPPRYLMVLTTVTLAEGVIADEALVVESVRKAAEAAMAAHPQLVVSTEGAPAEDATPAVWKKWLGKQKLAGAFKVNLIITTAEEDVEPQPAKKGQRFSVKLAVQMFGETMPLRTMGFTGEGGSTVKQEVGMKLRDGDRRYSWESAGQEAMPRAIETSLAKLSEAAAAKK